MKNFVKFALSLALVCAIALPAVAGETKWPERAVEFVVPANPGGDTDINCRVFLKYMEKELGQSMVVVNMAGAAGAVGMNNVRQVRPNGYRALFYHSGALIAQIMDFIDFSIPDGFEVAGIPVIDKSNCFVSNVKAPYNNIKELVDYAKAHPDDVSYATESGSFTHLHILALEAMTGASFNIADAGTASEKTTALLGGRVDVISTQYGLMKDYIKNGEFKCLGILSDERLAGVSDVPTFRDVGFDIAFDKFFYVAFPKKTPPEIIEKFSAAAKKVAENPDYKAECEKNFVNANYMSPKEAADYINGQEKNYRKYEAALLGE